MKLRGLGAAVAAAAIFVIATPAQPRTAHHRTLPLLGIVATRAPFDSLVRLDRKRVRRLHGTRLVDLGYSSYSWSFSPDRTLVAFGRRADAEAFDTEHAEGFLRIVDPLAMRVVGDVPIGRGILRAPPAWLTRQRIAAVAFHCCEEGADVVVADPLERRVVERRELPGAPLASQQGGARLAVLSGSAAGIAPVELVVVDGDGSIRSVVLDRIEGGSTETGDEADPIVDELRPALAVQRSGRAAFVIAADGLVAKIDLDSLDVSYHRTAPRSRTTAAAAKGVVGSTRCARVLPNGRIAVTGRDIRAVDVRGEQVFQRRPAGLRLIDPSTWKSQLVDRDADTIAVSGGRIVTTGYRPISRLDARGRGLSVYDFGGKRRFRLFRPDFVSLDQVYGTRAYVVVSNVYPMRVVDLRRGRVVGVRAVSTFPLLVGSQRGGFGGE